MNVFIRLTFILFMFFTNYFTWYCFICETSLIVVTTFSTISIFMNLFVWMCVQLCAYVTLYVNACICQIYLTFLKNGNKNLIV